MSIKPLKLYSHAGGPNPWKVAIILNELGLDYETKLMDFPDLKKAPFEKLNPNGRVPALEDPNTGLTLWESGAIIEYLLETYDGGNKSGLQYTEGAGKWEQRCWAEFQMSGQGPYFGQRAWFVLYAPEKIELCLDRYGAEIRRVFSIIDAHLSAQKRPYLCGEQLSYADLMFVPWHWLLFNKPFLMGEEFAAEAEKAYPAFWAWDQRMQGRESVKAAKEGRTKAMSGGH
ncbi:hypothetical protein LTR53_001379 [Teratosphaeriaceae sp. CCFEE 6253]|nr:hypothetical protein LTR53_001379 [Teratosphaeriaceae sp. CCFEE 6253]